MIDILILLAEGDEDLIIKAGERFNDIEVWLHRCFPKGIARRLRFPQNRSPFEQCEERGVLNINICSKMRPYKKEDIATLKSREEFRGMIDGDGCLVFSKSTLGSGMEQRLIDKMEEQDPEVKLYSKHYSCLATSLDALFRIKCGFK